MKCPHCVKEGKKSKVHVSNVTMSTLMCRHRYYDEDGKLHIDDPNTYKTACNCSNGHKGTVEEWKKLFLMLNQQSG